MIVHPKVRGFICTTAHPVGCAQRVQEQINHVKSQGPLTNGPQKVLVIGASTGYGLASRVMSAFGCHAATVGVFFEKEPEGKRTATAGWYNSVGLEKKAMAEGLYAKSFNGDAFSDTMREEVTAAIKKDLQGVDLIVYSLAAPRREHPRTGKVSKSVLKPIGSSYTGKSLDLTNNELEEVTLQAATQEEIDQTVEVMGGEDWTFWIDALEEKGLLTEGVRTVAYSYVGPELTRAIYRNGTIGRAKDHLEATAKELDERLRKINGRAFVSVNKALVTQSSSAIPFIPLYYVLLKKVMKEKNVDEDTIGQITRLFRTKLCAPGEVPVDDSGLIRMDDRELREDVQSEVKKHWENLTAENLRQYADLDGYHREFLNLFGFGIKGVDYDADVETMLELPSAI